MSTLILLYTAVANTVAPSASYNANNIAITNWANGNIDHSNLALGTGIYASDIKPLTGAEATFGLTATGVGYKFLANDATAVPLTVSGVSGQSADIFDVTLSGGTKAVYVNSAGALVANLAVTSTRNGAFQINNAAGSSDVTQIGATTAFTVAGVTGTALLMTAAGLLDFIAVDASGHMGVAGYVVSPFLLATGLTAYSSASAVSGDVVAQRSASTGAYLFGGATANGALDFEITQPSGFSFTKTAFGAYAPVFGTSFTNESDATLKKNVTPISGALALLAQLKPSTYEWIRDGKVDMGFVAQDVEGVLPAIVSTDKKGIKGIAYHGITALLVAAFQEYIAAHP